MMSSELEFQDWGLTPYQEALQRQLQLLEETFTKESPGSLIFCSHPPIVTLGRATKPGDVFSWDGEVAEVNRGGRATYHGPSQLVIYPIINLAFARQGRPAKELIGYLRSFENGIVTVLQEMNIPAVGKSIKLNPETRSENEETGVWVHDKKIASLGVAVKNWVTMHGAAINLHHDPLAYSGMKPCGFSRETMTSVEAILGHTVDSEKIKKRLQQVLLKAL